MLRRLMLLVLLCALPSFAFAQSGSERAPDFSDAELDQMLAPIALYPDQLLTQILMAATYPLEVVQAARWSRAHPELRGQAAVEEVDGMDWDPSVKSLVAFPGILRMMDEKIDWTEDLGDAFLAQEADVMDRVQYLRRRADEAGHLQSGDRLTVVRDGPVIVLRPAYPDVIYVPYYDPRVVYGTWWWPQYHPVYWSPWAGYGRYQPSSGFYWGVSINIGSGFFFGAWDWPSRQVRIVERPPFYYRRPPPVHYVWVHDREHRRGVRYRDLYTERRYVNDGDHDDGRQDQRPRGDWQYREDRDPRAYDRAPSSRESDTRASPGGHDDSRGTWTPPGHGTDEGRGEPSRGERWSPQAPREDRNDSQSDDRGHGQPQPDRDDRTYRQPQPSGGERMQHEPQPPTEPRSAPESRQQWQPRPDQPRHEQLRGGVQERSHGGGNRHEDGGGRSGQGGDGGGRHDGQE